MVYHLDQTFTDFKPKIKVKFWTIIFLYFTFSLDLQYVMKKSNIISLHILLDSRVINNDIA